MQSIVRLGVGWIAWLRYKNINIECFFQKQNNPLLGSNLVAADFALTCRYRRKVFYPKDTTARYALCEHQTNNLTVCVRRSNSPSYAGQTI